MLHRSAGPPGPAGTHFFLSSCTIFSNSGGTGSFITSSNNSCSPRLSHRSNAESVVRDCLSGFPAGFSLRSLILKCFMPAESVEQAATGALPRRPRYQPTTTSLTDHRSATHDAFIPLGQTCDPARDAARAPLLGLAHQPCLELTAGPEHAALGSTNRATSGLGQ